MTELEYVLDVISPAADAYARWESEQIHQPGDFMADGVQVRIFIGFKEGAAWAYAHPKSPWNPIAEKPIPNDEQCYLVRFEGGNARVCYINSNGSLKDSSTSGLLNEDAAVAWMPIPEYKQNKEDKL